MMKTMGKFFDERLCANQTPEEFVNKMGLKRELPFGHSRTEDVEEGDYIVSKFLDLTRIDYADKGSAVLNSSVFLRWEKQAR